MNFKVYKRCAVPRCDNTSIKTPSMLFVGVPRKKTIRRKWLKLSRRDSNAICQDTTIYFCEDHFDTVRRVGVLQWATLLLIGWGLIVLLSTHHTLESEEQSSAAPVAFPEIIRLDQRKPPTEEEETQEISRNMPNLPIIFMESSKRNHSRMFFKNRTCALFPPLYDLDYHNNFWQVSRTSGGVFYLFSAYYDTRELSSLGPSVRILAMVNRASLDVTTYCQFWFKSRTEPVIVKHYDYTHIWNNIWGNGDGLQPYLVTCKIPENYTADIPAAVSLVENHCDKAVNLLRVIYEKPAMKEKFAVCVKSSDLLRADLSSRLVEWMELLDIMGVGKAFFYSLHSHDNMTKVIDHYAALGRAEMIHTSLPGGMPNLPLLQEYYFSQDLDRQYISDILPYNDCLYKSMYSYEYVVLLDIDEVVIPTKEDNWAALMDAITSDPAVLDANYASYNIHHVYFLDSLQETQGYHSDIPDYMHILQHVHRSSNATPPLQYSKSFHDTSRVISLYDQFPVHVFNSTLNSYTVDATNAKVHNYRKDCIRRLLQDCGAIRGNPTRDDVVWKYKDDLIKRTTKTLEALGFHDLI